MKKSINLFIFFMLLSGSVKSFADTCPRIEEIKPFVPPAGWTFLIPPDYPLESHTFSAAIHSLNGIFYYGQIICRYDVCPSFLCPAFTLLSNQVYQEPQEPTPPWNAFSVVGNTLTCMPGDHDPAHCVFQ